MDVKDVKKLVDAVKSAELNELIYETGEVKVTIRRGAEVREAPASVVVPTPSAGSAPGGAVPLQPVAAAGPQPVAAPGGAASAPESSDDTAANARLVDVTAPIVGTFYEAASPDAAAFVQVGDRVKAGAVLCIIEAMKLMNEIEAETSGTIAEILVRNEEPVEYGQTLFRIDPD